VAKQTQSPERGTSVRTRRAYFDCRFGQLHVRTAFPTTGGFDEEVPLICLHEGAGSSRTFAPLLALIAINRSVYAPDLPGCGESDPAPSSALEAAALAVADLAADLRLRQIDVLGLRSGAGAALQLAARTSAGRGRQQPGARRGGIRAGTREPGRADPGVSGGGRPQHARNSAGLRPSDQRRAVSSRHSP